MEDGNAMLSWEELKARLDEFEESRGFEEIGCAYLGGYGKPGEAYERISAVVRLETRCRLPLKCKIWEPKFCCQVDYEWGVNRVKLEVKDIHSLRGWGNEWREAIREIECDLLSAEFGGRKYRAWQKNQLVRHLVYACLCNGRKDWT